MARIRVPLDGSLGDTWTDPAFDDNGWMMGPTGVGFDGANTGGATNALGQVILNLDFNDDDSGEVGAANTESGFSTMTLSANPSTFNGITVTLSALGGGVLDDRDRTSPIDAPPNFTQDQLYDDFIFVNGQTNGNGMRIRLAGLPANQEFYLTIWSFDSGSVGSRVSDWIETASGPTNVIINGYTFDGGALPTQNGQDTFGGYVRSSAAGVLQIEGRRSGGTSHGVFLNALQLAQIGYGSLIATDIGPVMSNQNASVFIRIPFTASDPASIETLKLRMKYDDGFAAYLNGQLVATRNAPVSPPWDSAATMEHPNASALAFEEIAFANSPGLLLNGPNVLAIHGLNISASDRDFLILPELEGMSAVEDAGRYLSPSTPGAPNGPGYAGFVADTKFSADRGFYDTPFSLSITSATAGAEIRFTTNGSPPSPTNGFVFTGPISIAGQSFIRAAAFKAGLLPSDIDTHSYIFLHDVLRQSNNIPNYPAAWQAGYPADYAMDPNIVNHPVYGATISNDLRSLPTLCIVSDHNGLWNSATGIYPNSTSIGPAWERAISLELIAGDGQTEFATTGKAQIHGNASRDNVRTPKHSLGLSFNSDNGPAKLRYDWFGGGVEVQDKIVLRACGFVDGWAGRYADDGTYTSAETGESFRGLRYRPENTCYLRDVWVKDSFRAMGWSASRSAYVHLYINGLYWGLYEPSEHVDASYFQLLFGGPEGAWDVIVGEDNDGPPVVVDGSVTDWQEVLNIVNAGITNETAYQALAQRVDLDNLIDYMMVHIFAESEDWPRHNWYVAHRRATNGIPATKFVCSPWDQELTLDRLVRRNRIDVGNTGGEVYSPGRVYARLRAWPEFRRQFGDRIQKHLFNGGALTPTNNVARLLTPAAILHHALVGESARWGDARKNPTPGNTFGTGQTFTPDQWWQPEIDKLATNFLRTLTATNIARFRAGGLYPNVGAPEFNQFGGAVPAAFSLVIIHTNATGVIYFTTDGADPRVYGTGAVAPTALAYSAPVPLNTPTLVRCRVLSGGQWSALVEAVFFPPQDLSKLSITEIMYNPPALGVTNGDDFEFLELKNAGTNTLNLSGLTFTAGLSFTFSNGTLLAPGAFFVLARDAAAFNLKYPGVIVNGLYSSRLDNNGETLTLSHALGATIFSVTYDDEAPWPVAADNFGFSLVPKNPGATQAPDNGAGWRASADPGGSPGADDPPPSMAPILINEVLTASTPPQVDQIELLNPTSTNVDIGGWFLSDDPTVPRKYRIAYGTAVAAGGFLVFDETQFNASPRTNDSFSLSSHGESVYLFSGDANTNLTGYSHGFSFDAAPPGISFGRYVNSVGDEQFPAQLAASFMHANSGPRVGPLVINEIHYHPAPGGDEFVELQNISESAVVLFDPAYPANTWRLNGVGYSFPTNLNLEASGLLLLVATNPVAFRAKYGVPASVPILGPYAGALQKSGERLKLQRPDSPDSNGLAYITVDEIRYNDKAPWPPAADGSGPSLQRKEVAAYGNDPINWEALGPTPGLPSSAADTDGDGLPDAWEVAHGTDRFAPDADADPDNDGATNWQEYLAGTDPQSAQSSLKIEPVAVGDGTVTMQFFAVSNRTYSVLFKHRLEDPTWTRLEDLPARSTNRWETVEDSTDLLSNRFYRLVTPRWP
jgi:CotH kinase protein/Lamin Tail Domain/Chitobiase/beta-hexosaminidase C-terminal domain/Bacterial TSP3 repeat